jgi:predicted membrane-bound spermidine synthase
VEQVLAAADDARLTSDLPGDSGLAVAKAAKLAPWLLTAMLFCSGACGLVYQTVWMREFRLLFGASTAASAAVLAIFMGGLGLGGVVLGARVDRSARPLVMYGLLEALVALSAAATPALTALARSVYLPLGGESALGPTLAACLRLALSAIVLLLPTVLMGGTLPAASRALLTPQDASRRGVAMLYAGNALGAVCGALAATFFLLELLGNHGTLWLACGVNIAVAGIAVLTGRRWATVSADVEMAALEKAGQANRVEADAATGGAALAPALVYFAAFAVGLAFLLMELVWYRMLGPILGGSVFTFGLILAVALLGIGIGSSAYARFSELRLVTPATLALSCALEALLIAVPFALGDELAFLALDLRSLAPLGFAMQVGAWSIVTAIVVLPAALVAGAQFPLLIALLGQGRNGIGRQAGMAYGFNTLGAIVGSLAGGFGLLPLLSATEVWRGTSLMLCALAAVIWLGDRRRASALSATLSGKAALAAALTVVVTMATLRASGPTAVWRHSGIGAGRADWLLQAPRALWDEQAALWRRSVRWSADGVESSVAMIDAESIAFVVNGKNDGSVRGDSGTFAMSGLIGAALHPNPESAFVIGLGTGSSSGWLAAVPSIRRVDVVELEPKIVDVALACEAATEKGMANPKVRLSYGDAREVLLTNPQRYDLILSMPSNPYRAGVASLFTRDFYHSAGQRLTSDGLFLQWIQAYEVAPETIRNALATLSSEFPAVETWRSQSGDLIFVAARQPIDYDVPRLRSTLAAEPFASALRKAWATEGLEGFLAHFGASMAFTRVTAGAATAAVNTDDHNGMEFAFARSVGKKVGFDIAAEAEASVDTAANRPQVHGGEVDWSAVGRERELFLTLAGAPLPPRAQEYEARQSRHAVAQAYHQGDLKVAYDSWTQTRWQAAGPAERLMLAELLADAKDPGAAEAIERVRKEEPIAAEALDARLQWRSGEAAKAATTLAHALRAYRDDPWPPSEFMARQLALAQEIGTALATTAAAGATLLDSVSRPFAVRMWEQPRLKVALNIALGLREPERVHQALKAFEPNVPWDREFLGIRARNYAQVGDPLASPAQADFERITGGDSAGR